QESPARRRNMQPYRMLRYRLLAGRHPELLALLALAYAKRVTWVNGPWTAIPRCARDGSNPIRSFESLPLSFLRVESGNPGYPPHRWCVHLLVPAERPEQVLLPRQVAKKAFGIVSLESASKVRTPSRRHRRDLLTQQRLTRRCPVELFPDPGYLFPRANGRRFIAATVDSLSRAARSPAGTRLKDPDEHFTRFGHSSGFGPDPRFGLRPTIRASPKRRVKMRLSPRLRRQGFRQRDLGAIRAEAC